MRGSLPRRGAALVVVKLEQHAAFLRSEGAMANPGRPAGVGVWSKGRRARSVLRIIGGEVPRDQIDLFPIVVHERHGGARARLESKETRPVSHLVVFIESSGENLLLDPRRIAWR